MKTSGFMILMSFLRIYELFSQIACSSVNLWLRNCSVVNLLTNINSELDCWKPGDLGRVETERLRLADLVWFG